MNIQQILTIQIVVTGQYRAKHRAGSRKLPYLESGGVYYVLVKATKRVLAAKVREKFDAAGVVWVGICISPYVNWACKFFRNIQYT